MGSAITASDSDPPGSADTVEASGSLTAEVLDNITAETERVRAAFTSPDGLTRVADGDQRHVAFTVVMVVTDERILFLNRDAAGSNPTMDAGTLEYGDLAAVAVDSENDLIEFSTTEGVTWRFPLPCGSSDTADAVCRHLRWVGEVRSRLVGANNDVELAAGEIRGLASEMDWEPAEERYAEARDRVDTIIDAVQWTKPIADAVIAPELTDLERTLESAYADLLIEKASSRLTLGQQLVENGDFEQARKVLASAKEDHEAAKHHADAVERSDAFQFGQQRELRDRLERLDWEIEAVAAEPIRQAHEAKILAEATSDPNEAIEHWETAFERYGNVLTLEWGDGNRYFAGETSDVREEMENAADELVAIHRTLARADWDRGVTAQQAGGIKKAMRNYVSAIDHLEDALELAREFQAESVGEMETRLELMESGLKQVRETERPEPGQHPVSAEVDVDGDPALGAPPEADDADEQSQSRTETEEKSAVTSDTSPKSVPDANDIAEMDTHQEIAFEHKEIETEESDTATESEPTDPASPADAETNGHDEERDDVLVRSESPDS